MASVLARASTARLRDAGCCGRGGGAGRGRSSSEIACTLARCDAGRRVRLRVLAWRRARPDHGGSGGAPAAPAPRGRGAAGPGGRTRGAHARLTGGRLGRAPRRGALLPDPGDPARGRGARLLVGAALGAPLRGTVPGRAGREPRCPAAHAADPRARQGDDARGRPRAEPQGGPAAARDRGRHARPGHVRRRPRAAHAVEDGPPAPPRRARRRPRSRPGARAAQADPVAGRRAAPPSGRPGRPERSRAPPPAHATVAGEPLRGRRRLSLDRQAPGHAHRGARG